MTREIPLGKGRVCLVDDEDFAFVSQFSWRATGIPTHQYAKAQMGPREARKTVAMHRLLLDAKRGQVVDHINHNTLDNRRVNLRLATHAENQKNRKAQRNLAGFKGVRFWQGRYYASITTNYQVTSLGGYATAIEAAVAYDRAASAPEHHGRFCSLNFPAWRDWIVPVGNAEWPPAVPRVLRPGVADDEGGGDVRTLRRGAERTDRSSDV